MTLTRDHDGWLPEKLWRGSRCVKHGALLHYRRRTRQILQLVPARRVARRRGCRAAAVNANCMCRPQATVANVRRIQSVVRSVQISVRTAGIAQVRNGERRLRRGDRHKDIRRNRGRCCRG